MSKIFFLIQKSQKQEKRIQKYPKQITKIPQNQISGGYRERDEGQRTNDGQRRTEIIVSYLGFNRFYMIFCLTFNENI